MCGWTTTTTTTADWPKRLNEWMRRKGRSHRVIETFCCEWMEHKGASDWITWGSGTRQSKRRGNLFIRFPAKIESTNIVFFSHFHLIPSSTTASFPFHLLWKESLFFGVCFRFTCIWIKRKISWIRDRTVKVDYNHGMWWKQLLVLLLDGKTASYTCVSIQLRDLVSIDS